MLCWCCRGRRGNVVLLVVIAVVVVVGYFCCFIDGIVIMVELALATEPLKSSLQQFFTYNTQVCLGLCPRAGVRAESRENSLFGISHSKGGCRISMSGVGSVPACRHISMSRVGSVPACKHISMSGVGSVPACIYGS